MARLAFWDGVNKLWNHVVTLAVSAGVGSAGGIPQLDANGKLDSSFMPSGIGADTTVAPATEALSAGDFVNFWSNAGVLSVRKADASAANGGKKADGFVKTAVANAANATVLNEGQNDQLGGLTIGAEYFLSATTPGAVTNVPPTTAGQTVQYLGKAVTATTVTTEIDTPILY
jgi:hypothetical protein